MSIKRIVRISDQPAWYAGQDRQKEDGNPARSAHTVQDRIPFDL
jgi:hypothetical protein